MQSLEVSGAVGPMYGSLGVKGLIRRYNHSMHEQDYKKLCVLLCVLLIYTHKRED